jgi:hypothetical protein
MENKKDKKKELSKEDLESMELLQKSKEKQGKQIRIDLESGTLAEIDELRQLLGKQAEDPEEKYSIYYTGIRNILMKYLPSGKENEELRQLLYDEKNIFLNRGKKKSDNNGVRRSDGRMTYQEYMSEMLDVVTKWVSESQVPIDLYHALYELNENHRYGHEEYDKTSVKYHLAQRMHDEK